MSVRKLNTIQKREKLNNVYSIDDKGNGGANHKYVIVSNEKVNEKRVCRCMTWDLRRPQAAKLRRLSKFAVYFEDRITA